MIGRSLNVLSSQAWAPAFSATRSSRTCAGSCPARNRLRTSGDPTASEVATRGSYRLLGAARLPHLLGRPLSDSSVNAHAPRLHLHSPKLHRRRCNLAWQLLLVRCVCARCFSESKFEAAVHAAAANATGSHRPIRAIVRGHSKPRRHSGYSECARVSVANGSLGWCSGRRRPWAGFELDLGSSVGAAVIRGRPAQRGGRWGDRGN